MDGCFGIEPVSFMLIYLRTEQFIEIVYLFAGLNTGFPSCYLTTY